MDVHSNIKIFTERNEDNMKRSALSKMKTLSILIMTLFMLISMSPVSAMEVSGVPSDEKSANKLEEAQKYLENLDWDSVLKSNDNGTSVELKKEEVDVSVMPIENLKIVAEDTVTNETTYYQEAIVSIPIEALASTSGIDEIYLLGDSQTDPNNVVSVRLGIFYTKDSWSTFADYRIDGIHVEYQVNNYSFWFTNAETGYRIMGDGGPGNYINYTYAWHITNAPQDCDIDYFQASPFVKVNTGEMFSSKAMFYGTLTNGTNSWSFYLEQLGI